MTPFPEREHSETLEQGDAELLPEYIDAAEVGVVKNWEDNSFFANVYYRRVNNVINRVNSSLQRHHSQPYLHERRRSRGHRLGIGYDLIPRQRLEALPRGHGL